MLPLTHRGPSSLSLIFFPPLRIICPWSRQAEAPGLRLEAMNTLRCADEPDCEGMWWGHGYHEYLPASQQPDCSWPWGWTSPQKSQTQGMKPFQETSHWEVAHTLGVTEPLPESWLAFAPSRRIVPPQRTLQTLYLEKRPSCCFARVGGVYSDQSFSPVSLVTKICDPQQRAVKPCEAICQYECPTTTRTCSMQNGKLMPNISSRPSLVGKFSL